MPLRQPQNYQAKLIHRYDLTQDFTDFFGGPALEPLGGTRSSTGYAFAGQQGLKLTNLIPNDNFSLLIDFEYTYTSFFNKLVDATNLTTDTGIYLNNSSLAFYSPIIQTNSPQIITGGVARRILLVSDAEQPVLRGYSDGLLIVASVIEDIAKNSNGIVHLFQDDTASGTSETLVGNCTQIAIFEGALSNQQALLLGGVGTIF